MQARVHEQGRQLVAGQAEKGDRRPVLRHRQQLIDRMHSTFGAGAVDNPGTVFSEFWNMQNPIGLGMVNSTS